MSDIDWTKEMVEQGLLYLGAEETRVRGQGGIPGGSRPGGALLCTQEQAGRLRRHPTAKMAVAAGHSKQSLMKVIRLKCLDCTAGSSHEVAICHLIDCPCWPYRFGKNPFSTRKGPPAGNIEALRRAREARA